MNYVVTVEMVRPRLLAAYRDQARMGEIGRVAMPALDQVWAFLKSHPELRTPGGHNVFLYHHPPNRTDAMTIDFGVEVALEFDAENGVAAVATPAGEAARTLYVGPYAQMRPAHDAVHAWARENGRRIGGYSWEVYGDWAEDESKLETEIFYLLAP